MKRSERENRVMDILDDCGWNSEIGCVSGAIMDWEDRFPMLKFVQDGREKTGWTRDGRGTSVYDAVRLNPATMFHDWLNVKTATIGKDGKLPSKLAITTGTAEHIAGLLDGINNGASVPTVVFAEDADGEGFALAFDLAVYLRGYRYESGLNLPKNAREVRMLECPPEGGWGRGDAPMAWIDVQARKCGDMGKGVRFYNCLTISLFACGFKKTDWVPCSAESLPIFVERSFDWAAMAKV